MAEMISSSGSMEMAVKSNGVVDMSPVSLIAHNALSNSNCKAATLLSNIKEAIEPANYSKSEVNSTNAANLNVNSPPATTFRCERCDNFETSSRAALLLHVVQCLSSHGCLRNDDNELDKNATLDSATASNNVAAIVANSETASQHASSSSASSSSSTTTPVTNTNNNHNNNNNNNNSNNAATARKVFECDVCNMKFSNGANMRRHKMRHTGVKPYECRVCQKRFFRKDHLAEHFTTHTKTLPYHCPICNRGFQRQIAMRAHFQNEHVGQHDLVKTCPLCSYRAGSMKSLRIHFFNR